MKRTPRRRRDAVTMSDVAKHAGVSPMTVSRALSGDVYVDPPLRQRVQAAVKELGYLPNVAASSLARAEPIHVGLLYNNPSVAYLDELLVGVLEQSSRAGCQVFLEKCGSRNERTAIGKLLRNAVGGVILPPPLSDSNIARAALRAARVPFIAIATGRAEPLGLSVRINDCEAAAAMTRYLLSLGHRDLGFIIGAANQTVSAQRQAGFELALREAGVPVQPEWIKQGSFTYRSGLLAAQEILNAARRPTAIFASNDDMAGAAITVVHRAGLKVPQDITVVGFDDTPLATAMWPSLTTVRQPVTDMARKAVELLLEEIRRRRRGETLGALEFFMDFALIERESSAAVCPTRPVRRGGFERAVLRSRGNGTQKLRD